MPRSATTGSLPAAHVGPPPRAMARLPYNGERLKACCSAAVGRAASGGVGRSQCDMDEGKVSVSAQTSTLAIPVPAAVREEGQVLKQRRGASSCCGLGVMSTTISMSISPGRMLRPRCPPVAVVVATAAAPTCPPPLSPSSQDSNNPCIVNPLELLRADMVMNAEAERRIQRPSLAAAPGAGNNTSTLKTSTSTSTLILLH